ncbi:MAG: hypothetical protein ACREQB_06865 [Candidatus Binataceae bacterium]
MSSPRARLILDSAVNLRTIYGDWRVVGGVALAMLGVGNWYVGATRTQQYNDIVARAASTRHMSDFRSFDELDPAAGGAVLAPLSAQQRKVSYATARMDFYHAAFLTGRAMVIAGVILMLIGFIRIIQRDARHALDATQRARPPGARS